MAWLRTVFTQFRLHPSFWGLVPQLQTHLIVKSVYFLLIDGPSFAAQQNMHTTIPKTNTCLTDLLDPKCQSSLIAASGFVRIKRTFNSKRTACTSDRYLPDLPHFVHKSPAAIRLQSFLTKHPAASLCPKINPQQSSLADYSRLPVGGEASFLMALNPHIFCASYKTWPDKARFSTNFRNGCALSRLL